MLHGDQTASARPPAADVAQHPVAVGLGAGKLQRQQLGCSVPDRRKIAKVGIAQASVEDAAGYAFSDMPALLRLQ
jgi:hypothetical protein